MLKTLTLQSSTFAVCLRWRSDLRARSSDESIKAEPLAFLFIGQSEIMRSVIKPSSIEQHLLVPNEVGVNRATQTYACDAAEALYVPCSCPSKVT